MLHFFNHHNHFYYTLQTSKELDAKTIDKLNWLFGESSKVDLRTLRLQEGSSLLGPKATMVSPWSTNAVEITQNMGIEGIARIEEYKVIPSDFEDFDPMLMQKFQVLTQDVYDIHIQPESIQNIEDISAFNQTAGLALSEDEVGYL